MLLELHIEQFAIIERLDISFGPGFTALTGETGAGKSVVVDAIGAVLGAHTGAESVRHEADKALIQAVFDVSERRDVLELLRSEDIEPEDGTIVVTRIIPRGGRSRIRINGRVVTLSALRRIGERLVDICGQHEHQSLTEQKRHVEFLDAIGGEKHAALLQQVSAAFGEVQRLRTRLSELQVSERDRVHRLDLLRFQIREIDALNLQPGEEEALRQRRRRLANAERLSEIVANAYAHLADESATGISAIDLIGQAEAEIEQAAALDPDLEPVLPTLQQAGLLAQDAAGHMRDYLDGLDFEPDALEEVESRLAEIAKLKRKYGDTVEEILAFRDAAVAELEQLEGHDIALKEIEKDLQGAEKRLSELVVKLSEGRRMLADCLSKAVKRHLRDLGMDKVVFEVQTQYVDAEGGIAMPDGRKVAVGAGGADHVQFLISTNPGEPPGPLARIASGGELSRVMLAIKSALSARHDLPTLIFDEIDSGIGGRTATALGEKLAALAVGRQVLVVTHLPAIATMADEHYAVIKTAGRRAHVRVECLDEKQRVEETARMLGAQEKDSAGREHAREMVVEASKRRLALRSQVA